MTRHIRPAALNILGGERVSTRKAAEEQPNFVPKRTWKDKVKSCFKKVLGFLKRTLDYTKDVMVPIAVAAAGLLNAWNNFQRKTESGRCTA